MLVIVNLLAVLLLALLPYDTIAERVERVVGFNAAYGPAAQGTVNFARRAGPDLWVVFGAAVVAVSYVVIYLGIAALIVRAIRRYTEVRLPVPVVINVLLLMLGCLTPWVAQMTMTKMRNTGWTLLQIPNPAWTLSKVCFDNIPYEMPTLMLGLSTMAAVVWLLNLPPLLDDLKQVRIAKPARVEEEDARARHCWRHSVAPRAPGTPTRPAARKGRGNRRRGRSRRRISCLPSWRSGGRIGRFGGRPLALPAASRRPKT